MRVFFAIFAFIRGVIATKGRLIALTGMGIAGALIALAIGASNPTDPIRSASLFISGYGMTLMVPIISLVFATAALGNLVEDNSLVYLWMRPTNRSLVAGGATAAAWVVAVPLVVIPLVISAFWAGGGGRVALATTFAATLGIMAYCSLFVAIGLRFKRALLWGLVYVLIWEGTVARSATGASRLSVQTYINSAFSDFANVNLVHADIDGTVAVAVLIMLCAAGIGLTTWLLNRREVA